MFKFSHTAVKGSEEQNGVVAVFTTQKPTTPMATAFNLKTARDGGARDMTLIQIDFRLATARDSDIAGELKTGRHALVQRQRYELHKQSAPAAEGVSNG